MTMKSYKVSDFPTVVTLILKKYPLIAMDATNPRRVIFEFENSTSLQDDLSLLNRGRLLVDPTDFWMAERRVKQLLNQRKNP